MAYKTDSTESPTEEQKKIQRALDRFKEWSESWEEFRRNAKEDIEFANGDNHWTDGEKESRKKASRPCLVINRIPQFIKQVTNEQRQNRISAKVSPVDSDGDPEVAEIYQGIIRHIEVSSSADVAYDTAFHDAVTAGLGYFRILTEYEDDESFNQEIKIERIVNAFSVTFDPACVKADFSDARGCFVVEDMPRSEFEDAYPGVSPSSLEQVALGDEHRDWIGEDTIRVAEYFSIQHEERELVAASLPDGDITGYKDELEARLGRELTDEEIIKSRKVQVPAVKWCKFIATKILEERDWPGKWIPIIPVLGDEVWINNRRMLYGMVRHSKDPQRMVDYWSSAITEAIALAPKAPYVAAAGQIEPFMSEWQESNVKNTPVLRYKPISVDNVPMPPPQRNAIEPAIQAMSLARAQAADDLKAVMGIYDASLGQRSNETSGKAIMARQREGDTATFNFPDNLTRSIAHGTRILLDLIPRIYDVPRIVRILGENDDQKQVPLVNEPNLPAKIEGNSPAAVQFANKFGAVEKIFNLGTGKYDLTVSAGPSYATRRQEAVESMMALAAALPASIAPAMDIIVSNMDWPEAQKVAERIRKTLPPELQDSPEGAEIPPQVKAQMDQALAQVQMLTEELQAASRKIEREEAQASAKIEMKRMDLEFEQWKVSLQSRIDLAKTQAQMESREGIELFKAEIAAIGNELERQSLGQPVGVGSGGAAPAV